MKTALRELDARAIPSASRHREIFDAFDSLPEGGSFVLSTDHDPRPLYDRFRSRNPNTFGWVPFIQGPAEWKVEISHLKPKDDEKEVGAYFARDHEEIDVLLGHLRSDLAEAVSNPLRPVAPLRGIFDEFDARLERHIRWEEEVLFPAVEGKAPELADGPGSVMREEHLRIREFKAAAGRNLARAHHNRSALESARRALEEALRILIDHNHKEEAVYYPMSDRLFPPAEAAAILDRIRALK